MIVKDDKGFYFNGERISEEKYNGIMELLRNAPAVPEEYALRLNGELEWETYEAPLTESELSESEALEIILGGAV